LVINLKTATLLHLTVPTALIVAAEQAIKYRPFLLHCICLLMADFVAKVVDGLAEQ
jgi:hypothetical protein